jgi:hypothetical protein
MGLHLTSESTHDQKRAVNKLRNFFRRGLLHREIQQLEQRSYPARVLPRRLDPSYGGSLPSTGQRAMCTPSILIMWRRD